MHDSRLTRRQALRAALLGSGLFGLQALATGLPRGVFRHGLSALDAHAAASGARRPQYLLLLTSSAGEPINANAPGAYGIEGITNNLHPEMAPTDLWLGGHKTVAAAPWATLPEWVRARTCFVHHRTYQNSHAQYHKVMGLVGSAKNELGSGSEHLSSLIASETAPQLGTIQAEPMRLTGGGEELAFQGRVIQAIDPSTLADVFAAPEGDRDLALAQVRDAAIDDLWALARAEGTPAQRALVDRFARSREQAQQLDESLVERFSTIRGRSEEDTVRAALTLFLMNLTPVVTVKLKFGGDNHADVGLVRERDQHLSALEVLHTFFAELRGTPIEDQVVVANLDVFGRTLGRRGDEGRDHNLNHHVMMISGAGVGPGVYGGIAPSGNDFGATGLDAATGQSAEDGDVPPEETLEAVSKTLATVCGVAPEAVERRIDGGKVIAPAVTPA